MKFRKMACGCCRTGDAAKLCKSPTFVISDVTDDSNLVFLLMNMPSRTPCRGEVLPRLDSEDLDTGSVAAYGGCHSGRRDVSDERRAEPVIDGCWRPTWSPAFNDDFEVDESPRLRNRRLLAEGSKFWPRRRNRNADGALRDWE